VEVQQSGAQASGLYQPVSNHECQYSIWPAERTPPLGWWQAGPVGSRDEVLSWIASTWCDIRPTTW